MKEVWRRVQGDTEEVPQLGEVFGCPQLGEVFGVSANVFNFAASILKFITFISAFNNKIRRSLKLQYNTSEVANFA